jgi:hypothetical protein
MQSNRAGVSLVGKLQANQTCTLWASTRAASFQNVPRLSASGGNDSPELQFASGAITKPVIPEPGIWALCLAGVGLAVRRRRPH